MVINNKDRATGPMKITGPSIIRNKATTTKTKAIIKKIGDKMGRETTTGEDFRQGPTPEHPNLLQLT